MLFFTENVRRDEINVDLFIVSLAQANVCNFKKCITKILRDL